MPDLSVLDRVAEARIDRDLHRLAELAADPT